MTKEEIVEAGIDISGKENYNGFTYNIKAEYDAAGIVIQRDVVYDSVGDAIIN